MRIVHVISSIDLRAGGPSSALLNLAAAQAHAGMEVSVVSTWAGEQPPEPKPLVEAGVKLHLIGPCHGPLLRHPQLRQIVSDALAGADVGHLHGLWEDVQYRAARIASQNGIPYVLTPHGMLTRWSMAQKRLKKLIYLRLRLRRVLEGASVIHYTTAV